MDIREIELLGGLVGRAAWRRFRVEPSPHDPDLLHLVLLDAETVTLSAYRADALVDDYTVQLDDDDARRIDALGAATVEAWAILSRYELPAPHITANLRAPILVDPVSGHGYQVVQVLPYPLRHVVAGLDDGEAR